MSAISANVETAVYTALNVSAVTNLATGGVWNETAQGSLPYLVFNRQAPGLPVRVFGGTVVMEDDLWSIRAYANEDSHATKSARQLINEILAAAETALGNSLTLAVGETLLVWRHSDLLLPTEEPETDKPVYARGFLARIAAR